LVAGCRGQAPTVTRTLDLPYARCSLTLAEPADEETFASCFERIEQIFGEMDMYREDSQVSAVSRAAGLHAVEVSEDVLSIMRQGLALAAATKGRFDPTVGPLVRLWGIGSPKPRVPGAAEIGSALGFVDWKRVAVDERAKTIFLQTAGMSLDFGALAKGFAAVEAGRVLSERGVKSAILDIGGSVLALGSAEKGGPWRVGIQNPSAPRGTLLGVVLVRDEVVNTSGTYERFFVADGKRYHHIMDTRNGRPVENGIEAVTVIGPRLRNADGPSLSILTLGTDAGIALARGLGVDTVIVGADRTLTMTPGARRVFKLLDTSYTVVVR
jgi:thiamine biosynthesis lipoprotein